MKTALLAGTHSDCGKTTLMLTLLQYFQSKQHTVQAFKAGCDFIDPMWHQAITGKPSYNLDTRMMGAELCQLQIQQHNQANFALIEGVMGLFDGAKGVGGEGSSVDLARVLECPVILVVDAKGIAGTIAALVSGFYDFAKQKGVTISGVIANKVGSSYHAQLLAEALNDYELPPLIAWMERSDEELASRHLGLKTPENSSVPNFLPFFHVNESAFNQAFSEITYPKTTVIKSTQLLENAVVAISKDAACCFIYPANLDWLKLEGAEIIFFSPVAGEPIPENATAVWLTGGYPELFAEQLSHSKTWESLKAFVAANKPVLAECGGAMILGKELVDSNGKHWAMANVLPYVSVMQPKLAALGYREEKSGLRGHEFHYSKRENDENLTPCFDVEKGDAGICYQNLRTSYVHWFFTTAPEKAVTLLTT
jgi:cobyrinic acid a,c-diamide synthase